MSFVIFIFLFTGAVKSDDCVPPSLSNGDVYGEGDDSSWTGEFKCKPGFALVGSSRLKCRNGQWSGSIPACAATGRCDPEKLPDIPHGRKEPYKSTQYRGAVYKYSCFRGFKRLGSNLVHCNGDQWDLQRLPICSRRGCDESQVKDIVHGQSKRKAHGGVYFFKCDPSSVLVGSPVVVCNGKTWNDTTPMCITPTQHPELKIEKEGVEVADVLDGSLVSLVCYGAGGNPEPLLTILKDGKAIGAAAYSKNVVDLVATSEDNLSVFSCTAENAAMSEPVSSEVMLNVKYGATRIDIRGPDHLLPEESRGFECVSSPSNPPTELQWKVTDNFGEDLTDFLQESEVSTSWNGKGWQSFSSAELHGVGGRTLMHIECVGSNSENQKDIVGMKQVTLKFPPEKLMLIGPSKVLIGSKVTLQCESSPSVPATILSWSVEQDGKTSKHYPSESVEQLEDGSFITRSELHLVAKQGHDLMVQCYGTNEVLENDFKAFAHVIEILSPPGVPRISGVSSDTKEQNLICSTSAGNPPAVLSWYRDDEMMDSVYQIEGDMVSAKITFIPRSPEELITCEASNEAVSEPVKNTIKIELSNEERDMSASEQESSEKVKYQNPSEAQVLNINKLRNEENDQKTKVTKVQIDINTTKEEYVRHAVNNGDAVNYETIASTQMSTHTKNKYSESPTDAVYVLPDKQVSNTHSLVTAVEVADENNKGQSDSEAAAHQKYTQGVNSSASITNLNLCLTILVVKFTARFRTQNF